MRKQLHISAVNMLNDCGERFFRRYILGEKRPPNAYILVGKSVDETVSRNLQHKIEKEELLPRGDVLDIAATTFEAEQIAEPIELEPDEKEKGLETVLGENKDKSVALAGLHYDSAAPLIVPSHVRRKFSIDLDGFLRKRARELHERADDVRSRDKHAAKELDDQGAALNAAARDGLDLAGEIDLQETKSGIVVRDTKTSGKSPTKSLMDGNKTAGIADDSEQLTAYAAAVRVLDGKLPDLMVLDYLIQTTAKKELKYVVTKTMRTDADVTVFLNRLCNAVHAIRRGIYIPANPQWWGCSPNYCGFFDTCPYTKKSQIILLGGNNGDRGNHSGKEAGASNL